jgi:hypothetical protein
MVHELLRLLIHTTSVYHDNITLPGIVQGEDLSKSRRPRKEDIYICLKRPSELFL